MARVSIKEAFDMAATLGLAEQFNIAVKQLLDKLEGSAKPEVEKALIEFARRFKQKLEETGKAKAIKEVSERKATKPYPYPESEKYPYKSEEYPYGEKEKRQLEGLPKGENVEESDNWSDARLRQMNQEHREHLAQNYPEQWSPDKVIDWTKPKDEEVKKERSPSLEHYKEEIEEHLAERFPNQWREERQKPSEGKKSKKKPKEEVKEQ